MPNHRCNAGTTWMLMSLAALATLVLTGCNPPKFYPARGKIIILGVGALSEGEVRFQPVSRPNLLAIVAIQPDGTFTLATPAHGEGVLEGVCKVAIVVPAKNGKLVIDERYGDFSTSDFRFTVTPRAPPQENFFMIDVTPPGR